MTRSLPRLAAAAVLAIGGSLIAVSALGMVAAKVALANGFHVRPADAALLDDLVALAPFAAAFAAASLIAALALLSGREWGDRLATAIATIATSIGLFAIALVVLGHDPFTTGDSITAAANGMGILAVFTAIYVTVIVALSF